MLEPDCVIAPGQRRAAEAVYSGLTVRVVSESPFYPGNWICLAERTGRKLVIPADALGELLPDPYANPPGRKGES